MSRVGPPSFHNNYRSSRNLFRALRHAGLRAVSVVAVGLFMSACAMEGDFGRIRPTVFSEIADDVLLNTDIMTRGLKRPELNRDEIVLREAGDSLRMPLDLAPQTQDIPLRSQAESYGDKYERYNQLLPPQLIARELDKDHQLLTRFGEAARRVLRSYSQQMEDVLRYDPHLRERRREEARVRMQQNFDYIEDVFAEFGHRLQAYHYAIGSVRVHEDSPFMPELQGSLAHLRDRTAALDYELRQYFGAVMARTDYFPSPFPARDDRGRRSSARAEAVPKYRPDERIPYEAPRPEPFK